MIELRDVEEPNVMKHGWQAEHSEAWKNVDRTELPLPWAKSTVIDAQDSTQAGNRGITPLRNDSVHSSKSMLRATMEILRA